MTTGVLPAEDAAAPGGAAADRAGAATWAPAAWGAASGCGAAVSPWAWVEASAWVGGTAGLLRPDGPLADRLKLTGTQKDKLHGIGEDLARKMIQHRADMATARLDLMDLIKNNSSDRSRIDSQIDTIAKLRADGMKTRITALLDARDVLTSEQRSQLEEWRGSRGPGRGGRR
jgi:Spy/CpxP family protein refolding chaperone